MRKILGYILKNVPINKIELPVGSRIFAAMDVNGEPTVFADIDGEERVTEFQSVYRVVTGRPVDQDILSKVHIGSFMIINDGIVYHFFTGEETLGLSFDLSLDAVQQAAQQKAAKAGPPEYPFAV